MAVASSNWYSVRRVRVEGRRTSTELSCSFLISVAVSVAAAVAAATAATAAAAAAAVMVVVGVRPRNRLVRAAEDPRRPYARAAPLEVHVLSQYLQVRRNGRYSARAWCGNQIRAGLDSRCAGGEVESSEVVVSRETRQLMMTRAPTLGA